eukprot:TRINITY_DN14767_c1_g1_i4.p1 TRINITY_DN14767_c1_g1~~TRINITY_DN14767_c1_g1_i4.p1  ORF type:complete len:400 (+),score=27.26 TRINITY_DN14767_c1_g1_i4:171-1370(+)
MNSEVLQRWIIYVNVMMYAICYMAQVPLIPYLVKSFNADTLSYGRLQTVFNLIQLFGGLLAGPLMDEYGAQVVFLLSFVSSAVSYGVTASSYNMQMLYLSRIPTLFQHAMLAARVLITKLSTPQERAMVLGKTGAAYGLGFAVGPMLGGWIGKNNLATTAWAAMFGSIASSISIFFLQQGQDKKKEEDKSNGRKIVNYMVIFDIVKYPGVVQLLVVKLLSSIAYALVTSTFTVSLQEQFGLNAKQNGFVMSYVGVITLIAQMSVVGWCDRNFGEPQIILVCSWGLFASYLAYGLVNNLPMLLLLLIPFCTFGMLLGSVNSAQLTKAIPSQLQGSMISIDMSIGSALRVVAPTLGTVILNYMGYSGVGVISSLFLLVLAILLSLNLLKQPRQLEQTVKIL